MTEAEFLSILRRLPLHPGAAGLTDDTAMLAGLTITTDTIVEAVHFLAADPPEDVAWKLVATSLSDLAAKGAVPEGVLLNYPLRARPHTPSPAEAGAQLRGKSEGASNAAKTNSEAGPRPSPGKVKGEGCWNHAFLTGFGDALTHFATPLLGGDTVSLPANAPRVLTLTAIGRDAAAPPRSGAQLGDALWVTGTIGDAGAGLAIARGADGPAELLAVYRRPQPLLAEGRVLAPLVHAMMDVSDGLLIDAERMAAASGMAVTIDIAAIPISDAYRAFAGDDPIAAATAGDDYQLLFAAAPDFIPPVPATRIGDFESGSGLTLHDAGTPVLLPKSLGYEHGQ